MNRTGVQKMSSNFLRNINMRKGLLRLWVVLTLLWTLGCVYVATISMLEYFRIEARLAAGEVPNDMLPDEFRSLTSDFCLVSVSARYPCRDTWLASLQDALSALIIPFVILAFIVSAFKAVQWVAAGFRD
jgi:hypothetical protein